ncbi:hypothetical protein [Kitasatospora sp. NPDC093806]|uniref:hypothetical protein n=1 Tax=Kitasatospora sp. NPDC093806 TaxID=3155075 RepID=UPI00342FB970
MLAWFVRISALLAGVATGVLSLWTLGLPDGVPLPAPGLVTLAWTVGGLVWLRVLTLWVWWSDDNHYWLSRLPFDRVWEALPKVSRRKGRRRPGLLRRFATSDFDSTRWVFLRQAAVWLLVAVSFAALVVLGRSQGSEQVRALVRAGAAFSTATVVEVSEVDENLSADDVLVYHAALVLALPEGGRVRVDGARTLAAPEPDGRVDVLWAPTAPELGGVVAEDQPSMSRYLNRDWGLTVHRTAPLGVAVMLVLFGMLPLALAAEDDGLQEVAWSPVAQTVHAAAVTGMLLLALPYLSGTAGVFSGIEAAWGGLLLLYFALPLRAILI